MGEFRGTEQIISAKQNRNIKEALTGASSILNIWRENRAIVLKTKQGMAIYSFLQRRDVIEMFSTSFGKSMIFTAFPLSLKPTLSNSNSIWNARTRFNEFLWTPLWSVGKQITIYNFLFLFFTIYFYNFTVFAMANEEISSSKTCMITISSLKSTIYDQITEMSSLSCTAMDLMTETVIYNCIWDQQILINNTHRSINHRK